MTKGDAKINHEISDKIIQRCKKEIVLISLNNELMAVLPLD
jgi:hypothetical protein